MGVNWKHESFVRVSHWLKHCRQQKKIYSAIDCNQGQALISVQRVCFHCRQLMRLEKESGFADG